jgi:hypothetical protein
MNGLPIDGSPIQSTRPMARRRILRATLFASFALALWAFARPARASSAPFCDDRGASASAMPPALDAPDEALARARSCPAGGDELSLFVTIARTHPAFAQGLEGLDGVVPARGVVLPRLAGAAFDCAPPIRLARGDATSRVERPPRT